MTIRSIVTATAALSDIRSWAISAISPRTKVVSCHKLRAPVYASASR